MVSLIFGVVVVLVVSTLDNIQEGKEIRHKIHTQIIQTIHAYQISHGDAGPDEIAHFITRYTKQVLPEEVITVPPVYNGALKLDDKPLWTSVATSDQVQIYLNPDYIASEATGADIVEITYGVLSALLMFFALWVYVTKSEQAKLERLLHNEERRRLTTALHEQEAYALLGRMTTTLSHELRTPVATLSNLMETFPKRIGDHRFAERFMQISLQELERMRRLIDNLLIYGKDLSLDNATWVDLKQLIREAAQRHDLNVTTDDIKCRGDKFYLDILFANLMQKQRGSGRRCRAYNTAQSRGRQAGNDRLSRQWQGLPSRHRIKITDIAVRDHALQGSGIGSRSGKQNREGARRRAGTVSSRRRCGLQNLAARRCAEQ